MRLFQLLDPYNGGLRITKSSWEMIESEKTRNYFKSNSFLHQIYLRENQAHHPHPPKQETSSFSHLSALLLTAPGHPGPTFQVERVPLALGITALGGREDPAVWGSSMRSSWLGYKRDDIFYRIFIGILRKPSRLVVVSFNDFLFSPLPTWGK